MYGTATHLRAAERWRAQARRIQLLTSKRKKTDIRPQIMLHDTLTNEADSRGEYRAGEVHKVKQHGFH
jgi:hypothetical protein